MKSSEKLNEKISTMMAELAKARSLKKAAASAEAERAIRHAVAASGLLALVRAGAMNSEQLESELRAVAGRAEKAPTNAVNAQPESLGVEPKAMSVPNDGISGKKSF